MDQIVYLKKRTAYSVLSVEGWINPLYEVPNFAGMTPLNIATRGWSINKGERGQFSIYVGLRFTFLRAVYKSGANPFSDSSTCNQRSSGATVSITTNRLCFKGLRVGA